jgi:taurine dioxygenase
MTGTQSGSNSPESALVQDWSGCDLAVYLRLKRAQPGTADRNEAPGEKSMETTAITLHEKPATFRVRQLSPALGAEIAGVDLRDPIDDARKQQLLDVWHRHLVILLRNQTLDEDAQVRFAESFGAPAKITSGRTFSAKHPSVMLISNIRRDGKPIGALPDGEMNFHIDQCHQEIPAKATVLYAIEIPSKGGNTLFSNAYAAYETLPANIKHAIAGRRALNAYDKDSTLRTARYDNAGSSCWHPVVRTHPATGRKALYVNRLMTREIEGFPRDDSDAILQQLFDHQEQPKFVYEHVWRPGDILMWDNRCTLHARTDFSAGERRMLRRVTILGEKPF